MLHSSLFALGVVALSQVHVEAQTDGVPIKNSTKECEPYYHAVIASALTSFPSIWLPATILPGDNVAQQKWDSTRPTFPTLLPRKSCKDSYGDADPDCWWTWSKCTSLKAAGIPPDVSVMPDPRTLGYGFDDGPSCSHNSFYAMFYIGSNVMDWPREAARAVTDGAGTRFAFMVGPTSTKCRLSFSLTPLILVLKPALQAIKLATGVTPTCWRPPFGDVDDRIRAIAHGLDLRTILWQYDSQDWQVDTTPDYTPTWCTGNIKPSLTTPIRNLQDPRHIPLGIPWVSIHCSMKGPAAECLSQRLDMPESSGDLQVACRLPGSNHDEPCPQWQ